MATVTVLAAWIVAVASLVPILIAVIQQPWWSDRLRAIASVILAGIAGLGAYVAANGLDGPWTPEGIISAVIGVILLAQAAYRGIWKQVGIRKLEQATARPRRART